MQSPIPPARHAISHRRTADSTDSRLRQGEKAILLLGCCREALVGCRHFSQCHNEHPDTTPPLRPHAFCVSRDGMPSRETQKGRGWGVGGGLEVAAFGLFAFYRLEEGFEVP